MFRNHGCWIVVCAVVVTCASSVRSAEAQSTLSQGWQQFSPDDFANEVRKFQESDTYDTLSVADRLALEARGKELFLAVDIANTDLSYHTIEMLHWVARYDYGNLVLEQTRAALLARQDDWTDRPYPEIRAKIVMMMRLQIPEAIQVAEARRWVAAGGTIAEVPERDLQYEIVRQAFSNISVVTGSYSVEWTGEILPPQTGQYVFSISRVDVNAAAVEEPVKLSMQVRVGNNVVLEAGPTDRSDPAKWDDSNWNSQSHLVQLTGGQAAPLTVKVTVEVPQKLPSGAMHAVLAWEGPGLTKRIIPSSSLKRPDTGEAGLKATYTWTENGQQKSLVRTDPNIDFAWTDSSLLLAQDTTIAREAADAMWQTMTSQAFLQTYANPDGTNSKVHPFIAAARYVSPGLTSEQRQQFHQFLLQNPAYLDAVKATEAVRFYKSFRFGNPDNALDVFGAWAARHADIECGLSDDMVFEGDLRNTLAFMATYISQQMPSHLSRLQSQSLELPDGRCSLPVAYTLACSYLGQKKIGEWIELLDAKVAEPSMTGDVAVNWYLARAYAEELDPTSAEHYPFYFQIPATVPLAGRFYLNQAFNAAESPATKLRVGKEIVGRLVWARKNNEAREFLEQLAGSLPQEQAQIAAQWSEKVNELAASQAQQKIDRAVAADETYVKTLQERRDKAAARNDTAAVERYNRLINAASGDQ